MIVWIDGEFLETDAARIGIDDRGFLLGDGVFDTFAIRDGAPKDFAAHMARLRAAAAAFGIPVPFADGEAEQAASDLAARNGVVRGAGRLTISRGPGPRGLLPPDPAQPFVLLAVAPAAPAPAPVRMLLSDVARSSAALSSRHKTLSYIDNVEARRRAALAGCGEALMLNERGEIACASAANIFWIADGALRTPSLDCGVLAGITRANLLRAAPDLGLAVEEGRYGLAALDAARAVFLANSVLGIAPVAALTGGGRERAWEGDAEMLAALSARA
jgi:branched-chain amino acid aminotransferase/4-amino-4-deoxychorismate lyase